VHFVDDCFSPGWLNIGMQLPGIRAFFKKFLTGVLNEKHRHTLLASFVNEYVDIQQKLMCLIDWG